MNQSNTAVKIDSLTKVYPSNQGGLTALDNISLEIFSGEIFGIIGLSGAGKSTLVRCMNYLERPTSGSVEFYGVNLGQLKGKQLLQIRQKISMIFQNFNLFEQRTVAQNISLPLELSKVKKQQRKQQIAKLLSLVGLSDKANCYPSQLSGGQQQRVAIARAIATNPQVLLCDEATSALDNQTTQTILQLLKKINAELGVTIVVITHEMKVIESICDRVAVIDNSKIAEVASVSQLFSNPQSDIARQLVFASIQSLQGQQFAITEEKQNA